jgi:hypothetical protein
VYCCFLKKKKKIVVRDPGAPLTEKGRTDFDDGRGVNGRMKIILQERKKKKKKQKTESKD